MEIVKFSLQIISLFGRENRFVNTSNLAFNKKENQHQYNDTDDNERTYTGTIDKIYLRIDHDIY